MAALNREPGVIPGRSRRCKDENASKMPLSKDGKADAYDDSKSEYLPAVEVRETTSDGPHKSSILVANYSLSSWKGFFIAL